MSISLDYFKHHMAKYIPHLYVLSKPHYKPMKKDLMVVRLYLSLIFLESLKRFGNFYEFALLYLSIESPNPRYLSEVHHLNLSGKVVDSFDSMSKNCNDCVRMVRKLYVDFLISSFHMIHIC